VLARVSVMETSPPAMVMPLLPELEAFGYHRFWTTEHHSSWQSGSPTVLATAALCTTSSLRIGTAGIMLRYQSALRTAEDFHLLEAFFPGRVDLGVISGRADEVVDKQLLQATDATSFKSFDSRARDLARLIHAPESTIPPNGVPTVRGPGAPTLWICGIGEKSAQLAAELGVGFAYSLYHAKASPRGASTAIVAAYRSAFQQVAALKSPVAVVACGGICARSGAQARTVWAGMRNRMRNVVGNFPHERVPEFLGSAAECREQIGAIANEYAVDEVMVECVAPSYRDKIRSYERLAAVFGLSPSGAVSDGRVNPPPAKSRRLRITA
jgi:luciferase family oxidoreductase group 1